MKKLAILAILTTTVAISAHAQYGWKSWKWIGSVPIPDGSGTNTGGGAVFAEIRVDPDTGGFNEIGDIIVDLIIEHTWQGDLKIWLNHVESQTNVMLIDRPGVPQTTFGFSNDNFGNPADPTNPEFKMYLDDQAQYVYDVGSPGAPMNNVVGFWKPEMSLYQAFLGRPKFGTWRLYAEDFAGGDIGAIRNFSLHIFNVPEPGTLLAIGGGLAILAARRRSRRK